MKIEKDRINDTPIILTEKFDPSTWDLDSYDIKFIKPIEVECVVNKAGNEILVEGNLKISRLITCSRCLQECEQLIHHECHLHYLSSSIGEYLSLDNDIREEILLQFPMKVLCDSACKGICPSCGVNLNLGKCSCAKEQNRSTFC